MLISMKIFRLLPVAFAVLFAFSACNNEFSPNAEWRETMVVYGLLDQGDDTTWIRVQKCFLGEGDMLAMTSIMDSSNYAEGELDVRVVEWDAVERASGVLEKTSETGKVFEFRYKMLNDKPEGGFYAPQQPVYYCRTKGQLDNTKVYELRVQNRTTGTLVTAETPLVGTIDPNAIKVNNSQIGSFTFISGKASIAWNNVPRARVFQPMIRFSYRNVGSDSLMSVDILCPTREVTNELVLNSQVSQVFFGSELTKQIEDHETLKNLHDSITLYLFAGDENMKMYRSVSAPPTTIVQERGIYTNINGGLGVFASRSTHVSRNLKVPLDANSEYRRFLKSLNIGF